VAIFRASLLPRERCPADSDRFNAMDASPADEPPTCGGDGNVLNNDVVVCFRRSLLPALPRYERVRGRGMCVSTVSTCAPGAGTVAQAPTTAAALAVSRKVSAVRPGGSVTLPVLLRLAPGARIATLQFAASVVAEGSAPVLAKAPKFKPAPGYPTPDLKIVEGERLLLGWLKPVPTLRRRRVQLGTLHFRVPETAGRGDGYTVTFNTPSGTSSAGDEVQLTGHALRLKTRRPATGQY